MESIRVELERSGGFGGISPPPMLLDTADLEPEAAREVAELAATAARAPAAAPGPSPVRDAMSYVLTIRRGGEVRRLAYDDRTLPPDLRPLLRYVMEQGRPRAG